MALALIKNYHWKLSYSNNYILKDNNDIRSCEDIKEETGFLPSIPFREFHSKLGYEIEKCEEPNHYIIDKYDTREMVGQSGNGSINLIVDSKPIETIYAKKVAK